MAQFTPSKIWDFGACLELFKNAVANQRLAMLRGSIDGVTREHQVQFLRRTDGKQDEGVWVDLVVGDRHTLDQEFRQKVPIEVSFSAEDAMLFFDSVIERRERRLLVGRRLLLRAPDKMSVIQQRKDGRVWVPEDCGLWCRLARVTSESADQRSEAVLPGRVWDLSVSGASMICPVNPAHVALRQDERLEFSLLFGDLRVDRLATVCYARPLSSRSVRLGLQFVDPADSPALQPGDNEKGVSPMQRLLNEVQAAATRQKLYPAETAKKAG